MPTIRPLIWIGKRKNEISLDAHERANKGWNEAVLLVSVPVREGELP